MHMLPYSINFTFCNYQTMAITLLFIMVNHLCIIKIAESVLATLTLIIVHILSGGITTLAFNRDALDEYLGATEFNANLDEFMARMTRGDIIPSDVTIRLRCILEVTHVRNSTQSFPFSLSSSLHPLLSFSLSLFLDPHNLCTPSP